MVEKNIWGMYFSATGTTKKVVKSIGEALAEKESTTLKIIDFTLPDKRLVEYNFSQEDVVVFGTPVIAGRVPNVLLKFLETIRGNGALAVPVVVYGNRNYDDALIELRDILIEGGFNTIAAGAFIGEHSFSKVLGKGRPDEKDMAVAKNFALDIYIKINSGEELSNIEVKGNNPLKGYYQPRDSKGNPVDIRKVKPKTKEQCDNCGICANLCPMGSIDFNNPREFIGICIKCGACIKGCPKEAKYYDDYNYLYHKEELELQYTRRAEIELFI